MQHAEEQTATVKLQTFISSVLSIGILSLTCSGDKICPSMPRGLQKDSRTLHRWRTQ